jgi:ribosome-binding factor A
VGKIRLERLNSLIAETVAELLLKKSKDPRLAPVTINRAEVAPNLQSARILYGVLGGDEERAAAEKALEKAKGFVRASLFEALSIKRIPQIRFELDRNAAHAARVSELLAAIGPAASPEEGPGQEPGEGPGGPGPAAGAALEDPQAPGEKRP